MVGSRNYPSRMHHRTPVLLIESHQGGVSMLSDALDNLGLNHCAIHVSKAEEVLTFLRTNPSRKPTLVFLDSGESTILGLDVLRCLKADDGLKGIPVIILGPPSDAETINESFDLGAAGYITKSPDAEGLVEAVRAIDRYWALSQVPQSD